MLGVERILSASAVGSLKQEYKPLDILVPDQFFDRTKGRISTFFGRGLVAHVAFAHPLCGDCRRSLADAAAAVGATVHRGGTYVNMEGPQFSTLAESNLYRSWGMDVIGMTNLQEAKLAREAEICYATLALVTDYDCWHPDHDSVTVDLIIANLMQNAATAQKTIADAVGRFAAPRTCACKDALATAIITRPELVPEQTKTRPRADHRQVHQIENAMKIVVTGSIAYDYLMSFPGKFTEHFLPEHMNRVSLSFLVDTMDKRRGGCAPNIAYTLALLGERPLLMATAGEDFGEYRQWLEAAGIDTSLVKQVPGKFCASFFCSTDQNNNQIASFYTGAMAERRRAVVPHGERLRPGDHLAERSRRDGAVRRGVPHAGHPVTSSIPASSARGCRATSCATGVTGATIVICNDYELELLRQKTGLSEKRTSSS